jgi:hypothetical protein
MRFDARLHNFWLPLVGGVLVALPAFFLGGRQAAAVSPPPVVATAKVELGCGPFVESFAAMRSEADRIALLASSSEAPLEDEVSASASTVETWREIAAAARSIDGWVWEANSKRAPLTLREAAVVSAAMPLTTDLRLESTAVVGDLVAPPSELDAASLVTRMDRIAQNASALARALTPLASCEASADKSEVSYAVPTDCETLDPEYQYAMVGPCRY